MIKGKIMNNRVKSTRTITFDCTDELFEKWFQARNQTGMRGYEVGRIMVSDFIENHNIRIQPKRNAEDISKEHIDQYIQKMVEKKLEELLK